METEETKPDGIAIIGMSGRFPGAKDVQQFWENLVNGVDSISRFREGELEYDVAAEAGQSSDQKYVSARGVLDQVDQFDAEFFDIKPREAELMDPQHRLFLECAWETLERAGYDPNRYAGLVGVFAGCSVNSYLLYNLCRDRAFATRFAGNYQVGNFSVLLGNDKDFLPTRVSYKLNLKGPSMAVQTACSTSLVAVCQACTNLLTYQCDMALAGGVSISFPQRRNYLYEEGNLVSRDGICRTFDVAADGTVFGSGVATLLLKRLADAITDGDTVMAVIKGFATNNDGAQKVGYAAPSVEAQAGVISMAQAVAGV
ncbi:MAG TPA: polyketide synthase, partial [Verrucomicrobiae bacterium]|nr:polyketide synthase [Verrucomicrobiae bacterium]